MGWVRAEGTLGPCDVRTAPDTPGYLSRQLITYIGNKRALLGPIGQGLVRVQRRLGRTKIAVWDAFAGSGVVSRFFKPHASRLVSNDLEGYAEVIARCFLANASEVDRPWVHRLVGELNGAVDKTHLPRGFVRDMYAPEDEHGICPGERVFYTPENARRLDDYRRYIEALPLEARPLLLGPLLSEASVHANTAGVFKGFYKDKRTGVGRYGGVGEDALSRIRGRIVLEPPLLSRYECDVEVFREDANSLARGLRGIDLAYLDPPYNQHPYGSNYFMLNLLVAYRRPLVVSRVSGIPADWQRSGYNSKRKALALLEDLVRHTDAPFLMVSSSDEGFISRDAMRSMLRTYGRVDVLETRHPTFRGSRNLRNRAVHVTEQLFLLERG